MTASAPMLIAAAALVATAMAALSPAPARPTTVHALAPNRVR